VLVAATGAVVAATATTALLLFRHADAETATAASTLISESAPPPTLEVPTTSELPVPSDPPATPERPDPVPQHPGPQPPSPPTTRPQTTPPTTIPPTTTTLPPPAPPPVAPSGLPARGTGETAIRLTWTDESTNESGFEINNGDVSRTVGADVQEYVWDGLTPGTYMCFHLRAVGDTGVSAWHPETPPFYVCATTTAEPSPTVDLVAYGIELLSDESTICAGSSPTFRASFGNEGTADSGSFVIAWVDTSVEEYSDAGHDSIPGGTTVTDDLVWGEIPPGPHELAFAVDSEETVPESDEDNNVATATFTVTECGGAR